MNLTQESRQKVFEYFDNQFGLKESTKGFHRMNCPFCGGRHTAAINQESLTYLCFKCTDSTSGIRIIMQLENLETFADAISFLKLNTVSKFGFLKKEAEKKTKQQKILALPDEYVSIDTKPDSMLGKIARKYMLGRGFSLDELALRGIGYCLSGEYGGYIIFPFYVLGNLKFFQGRLFAGAGPKMKNPPSEVYGIGKSHLIYNVDALFMYDEVNLVESITNALTLDENTIAILGKTLSDYQRNIILKSPASIINIALDPEAWGDALKMAASLLPYKRIKLTKLPGNTGEADINKLGYKESMKYINRAIEVDHRRIINLRLDETTKSTYN